MESANVMDKCDVAVQINDGKVVGHLPLGKSGKIAKSIFYFLKADKKHSCRNNVLGNNVLGNNVLGNNVLGNKGHKLWWWTGNESFLSITLICKWKKCKCFKRKV